VTTPAPTDASGAAALVREANAFIDLAEFDAAAATAGRAVSLDPGTVAGHVVMGWALENLERDQEARTAYEAALAIDPDSIGALEGLGNVLHRMGSHEQATASFSAVVEVAPSLVDPDGETLELIGWCQFRLGLHDEAVHTFRTSLTLEPERVAARFDLALTLLCSGQPERGLGEFERALGNLEGREAGRRRSTLSVALFDLREALAERDLATVPEADTALELVETALREAERA
jgi:tetratricopeptide (TPR) repeat protein